MRYEQIAIFDQYLALLRKWYKLRQSCICNGRQTVPFPMTLCRCATPNSDFKVIPLTMNISGTVRERYNGRTYVSFRYWVTLSDLWHVASCGLSTIAKLLDFYVVDSTIKADYVVGLSLKLLTEWLYYYRLYWLITYRIVRWWDSFNGGYRCITRILLMIILSPYHPCLLCNKVIANYFNY